MLDGVFKMYQNCGGGFSLCGSLTKDNEGVYTFSIQPYTTQVTLLGLEASTGPPAHHREMLCCWGR